MKAELTPEEEARLAQYRLDVFAECTTPGIDIPKAQEAVRAAYAAIGEAEPLVLCVPSPLSAQIVLALLCNKGLLEDSLKDLLQSGLEDSLEDSLRSGLLDSLEDALLSSLWDLLRNGLFDSLGNSLWESLENGLEDSLRDSLENGLGDSLEDSLRSGLGISLRKSLRNGLWDSLEDSLRNGLFDSLWDSLENGLEDSLRDSLENGLGDSLKDSLRSGLGDSLEDSLRRGLWDSLRNSLENPVWPAWYSDSYPAAWSAFYEFCGTLDLKKPYPEEAKQKLQVVRNLAKHCGWLWAYKGIAIVSAKPVSKWTDDRWDDASPVIHCANGPAVSFADGFKVYAWRGTIVPKKWILKPDEIPPEAALTHKNLELRRCAAEIMGWTKVIDRLSPKVIDADDPEVGTLVEVDLPDAGPTRFLRVMCGTGREFALCVPNEMQTALQANAWTYDLEPEDFAPELRT